jgi:hypothetical protein
VSKLRRFLNDWRDYRAVKRLPPSSRHIVIYAESGQDWHHYESVVAFLTGEFGQTVCYVSSDENDSGLAQANPLILPFCIGNGFFRILFFQTLKADLMLTQLLDLGNFDLKRSVHPVHYMYMFHSLISTHMADFANSFDHYDSILCAGPHQWVEIRKRESLLELAPKRLIEHGYHRLETLLSQRSEPPPRHDRETTHVLLAPSWGDETILNVCGLELTGVLLDAGFKLTLRPHFQTRWNTPEVLDQIVARYGDHPRFTLIEAMSESESLFKSHLMISDWSGAAMDYGLGLEKPVLFIDVPAKSRNNTWPELELEPFEMSVREQIGAILSPGQVEDAPDIIDGLLKDPDRFRRNVQELRKTSVFNLGSSSRAAAEAVVNVAGEIVDARRP